MTRHSAWIRPTGPARGADHDEAYDVVVVGGGLTGLTTALLLSRAGRRVLVVEGERVGHGSTGRSTAKVSVLQGTRWSSLASRHGEPVLRAYAEASTEGLEWLRRFCEDHDVPASEQTALTYATTPRGHRSVETEHRLGQRLGLPVRLTSADELPFATTGAVALDGQLQVDPMALVETLAAEAERHGAHVVEQTRVTRVRGRGPFRVDLGDREVHADAVVLATNYPLVDAAGLFTWFTAQRSYVIALDGDGPAGMHLSAETPSRSLRRAEVDGRSLLLVGGEGHETGRGERPSTHLGRLRAWSADHFPDREEVAAWSAQDFTTADGLPWMGAVLPGVPGLLAAGGFHKWGFTTGVAASLALTARLLGGQTPWAEPLTGGRTHVPGVLGAGRNGLGVGLELGRGVVRVATGSSAGEARLERRGVRPAATSTIDAERIAVSAVCTHLGGIVRWNDVEESWDCPLHGSRFAPDGSVLEGPARCGLRRL